MHGLEVRRTKLLTDEHIRVLKKLSEVLVTTVDYLEKVTVDNSFSILENCAKDLPDVLVNDGVCII